MKARSVPCWIKAAYWLSIVSVITGLMWAGAPPPAANAARPLIVPGLPNPFFVNRLTDRWDMSLCPDENESYSDCSLREAVTLANSQAPTPFTVVLNSTYFLTITGSSELNNQTGDLNIAANANVTIQGFDSTIQAAFDPASPDRVLQIASTAEVTVTGVTITGGHASDGGSGEDGADGGGIYNLGTLSLTDSAVISNTAGAGGDGIFVSPVGGAGGDGGGIYNGGTLSLNTSNVVSNTAGTGGWGYADGGMSGHGGHGGGVYSAGPTLTAHDSTIGGNWAGQGGFGSNYTSGGPGGSGGGIYNAGAGSALTLDDSALSDNHAGSGGGSSNGDGGSGGQGGGVYNTGAGSTLDLVNGSIIGGNRAGAGAAGGSYGNGGSGGHGGGICNDDTGTTLILDSVTLSDNGAGVGGAGGSGPNPQNGGDGGEGGGIRNVGAVTIRNNSRLSGNFAGDGGSGGTYYNSVPGAGGDGGALWTHSAVTVTHSIISDNRAGDGVDGLAGAFPTNGSDGGDGGGIWSGGGTLEIDYSKVLSNSAGPGGHGGLPSGTLPSDGGAGGSGGGIYSDQAVVTLDQSAVMSNNAGNGGAGHGTTGPPGAGGVGGAGGGIYNDPQLDVRYSTIAGNSAGSGGDVDVSGYGGGGGGGGGIYGAYAAVTLDHSTVMSNTAGDGAAGQGQYPGGNGGFGGGVGLDHGSVTDRYSTIAGNAAGSGGDAEDGMGGVGGYGGGISGYGGGVNLENSTVSGNEAGAGGVGQTLPHQGGRGGGIFTSASSGVDHSTIAFNHASDGMGGGLYITGGTFSVKSAIVGGNTASGNGPDIDAGSGIHSLGYNLIQTAIHTGGPPAGTVATDILGVDPRLDALGDNGGPTLTHYLFGNSPAIDVGSCTDRGSQAVLDDQRGVSRPQPAGGQCDIGAVEVGAGSLALIKLGPSLVLAGEAITYTLVAENIGPAVLYQTVLTDDLPSGLIFAGGEGCVAALTGGSVVTCTVGDLYPGDRITRTLVVTVAANFLPGSAVANSVVASAGTLDGPSTYASASAETFVLNVADLALHKSGPLTVTAGSLITYTLVVTNGGPSVAQAVDVKDDLAGVIVNPVGTIVRSGSGPALCGGAVCQVGDMGVNEVVTITLVGTVPASVAGGAVLTNTAAVFTDSSDPDFTNDTDSVETTVRAGPRLSFLKTALNDPVDAGDLLQYALQVTNDGPSDAVNVIITDTAPLSTTFSGAISCTESSGLITCPLGTIPAGDTRLTFIDVRVDPAVPDGAVITNTACLNVAGAIWGSSTVTTTVRQPLSNLANLSLVKTCPAILVLGAQVTYTIVVSNSGPGTANLVDIKDVLPDGLTLNGNAGLVRAGSGLQACVGAICEAQAVAVGEMLTMTVVATVNPSLGFGQYVTNTATVFSDTPDPDLADNTAVCASHTTTRPRFWTIDLPVILNGREGRGQADLVGSFEVSPSVPNSTTVVTITATVTNQGTGPAGGFWVDLYINPQPVPTTAGTPWYDTCTLSPCRGIAWWVPGLGAGQRGTLTSTPGSFDGVYTDWTGYLAPGTHDLYLYADSWSAVGTTGLVAESNENDNRSHVTISPSVSGARPTLGSAQRSFPPRRAP